MAARPFKGKRTGTVRAWLDLSGCPHLDSRGKLTGTAAGLCAGYPRLPSGRLGGRGMSADAGFEGVARTTFPGREPCKAPAPSALRTRADPWTVGGAGSGRQSCRKTPGSTCRKDVPHRLRNGRSPCLFPLRDGTVPFRDVVASEPFWEISFARHRQNRDRLPALAGSMRDCPLPVSRKKWQIVRMSFRPFQNPRFPVGWRRWTGKNDSREVPRVRFVSRMTIRLASCQARTRGTPGSVSGSAVPHDNPTSVS